MAKKYTSKEIQLARSITASVSGSLGGRARAKKLSAKRISEIARLGGLAKRGVTHSRKKPQ